MSVSEVESGEDTAVRLGRRVRELRRGRGMSQVDLAELLSLDNSAVSRVETRGEDSIGRLERIAEALDVDLIVELRERS